MKSLRQRTRVQVTLLVCAGLFGMLEAQASGIVASIVKAPITLDGDLRPRPGAVIQSAN